MQPILIQHSKERFKQRACKYKTMESQVEKAWKGYTIYNCPKAMVDRLRKEIKIAEAKAKVGESFAVRLWGDMIYIFKTRMLGKNIKPILITVFKV